MAEAAVLGHVGHGVAEVDQHVEVGQGGDGGTVEQRLAPLPATEQAALQAGAEQGLGQGVHGGPSVVGGWGILGAAGGGGGDRIAAGNFRLDCWADFCPFLVHLPGIPVKLLPRPRCVPGGRHC
ncbi:hypothetical protein D3C81_1447930 [compost metagenome]